MFDNQIIHSKYFQRVTQAFRCQPHDRYRIQVVTMHILPTSKYPAGIVSWPQEEIDPTDVKTWKLLTVHGGFHPMYSFLGIFEQWNIREYIKKTPLHDKLMKE